MNMTPRMVAFALVAAACAALVFAQDTPPEGQGGGRRGPAQMWLVNKTEGGVYKGNKLLDSPSLQEYT